MPSVADLVDPNALAAIADARAYSVGTAWADRGSVRLDDVGPERVTAEVAGDDGPHRVELSSGPQGLRWWCDCDPGGPMCTHVVATAVETWRRSHLSQA